MFCSPVFGSERGSGIGQKPLTLYLGASFNSGVVIVRLFKSVIVVDKRSVFVAFSLVNVDILSLSFLNSAVGAFLVAVVVKSEICFLV